MSRVVTVAAALLMLVAVVQLQATRERLYPPPEHPDPDMVYVSSGTAVRRPDRCIRVCRRATLAVAAARAR